MGTIYRSEDMTFCQLFLQSDSAYQCVAELGELGRVQFIDLNAEINSYQKKYVNEIRRCSEMERKLDFIEEEVTKDEIPIPDTDAQIPAPAPRQMVELEANFEKIEEELLSINTNLKTLQGNHVQLLEMKAVLEKMTLLLDSGSRRDAAMSISEAARGEAGPFTVGVKPEVEKERRDDTELKCLTGVIERDRVIAFERFMWRLCRGKVFVRSVDIEEDTDPFDNTKKVAKSVFILFFSGEQLGVKVKKIVSGFHGKIYNCSELASERAKLLMQIKTQTVDLENVIGKTLEYRRKIVNAAALSLKTWKIQVLKLKSVFCVLDMFSVDVTQKCLVAECWIPVIYLNDVRVALRRGTELSGSNVHAVLNEMETHREPPTYFQLNKFTQGFQNIVDAYGIAAYKEVNPAPWTIISFPFLFACMFGDAGHGIIMLLAALTLVLLEKKLIALKIKEEIFNTLFGGRYVVLLMGCFAIYTGFLYNDFYSKSINMFGSSWRNPYNTDWLNDYEAQKVAAGEEEADLTMPPDYAYQSDMGPYPFGLDPVWNLAKNKLTFLNTMKMKMSVVLGVTQMTFGLILSLMNHIQNHSVVDVLFVFIPQCLFLGLIFVYLCVQIILKWVFFSVNPAFIFGQLYPGSFCSPSLLIGLINMFMFKKRDPGFVERNDTSPIFVMVNGKEEHYYMYDQCYLQQWYPNEMLIEQIFIIVAVIAIPVMLFVKPFYILFLHKTGRPLPHSHGHGDESEEFSFGDTLVYQAIHTIEFALGCVSHTASYLRLWALSLAHAELSEVLWDMVIAIAFGISGYAGAAGMWFLWFAFSVLSLSILILMEGLSAFLHALRLHWVEFQSKFYSGTGEAFSPFSFNYIVRVAEGLEQ